jgi:hypothetical protein
MAKKKADIESPVPSFATEDETPTGTVVVPTEELIVPKQGVQVASGRFAKGYKVDIYDSRDYSAAALFGAATNLPKSHTLESYLRRIKDQTTTNSCVGQGWATAFDVRQRVMGIDNGEPSSLGWYGLARTLGKLSKDEKLQDEGAYPRLAAKAATEWGVPLESVWKFDESKVNVDLPLDVLENASATKVTGWYRIDAQGQGRVLALMQALSKGYPVAFGTQVDQSYEDWDGKGVIGPKAGKSLGGHCTCIIGYRTEADGSISFMFAQSWGKNWGQGGLGWLCEARITMPESTDFYVMTLGG